MKGPRFRVAKISRPVLHDATAGGGDHTAEIVRVTFEKRLIISNPARAVVRKGVELPEMLRTVIPVRPLTVRS